MGSWEVKCDRQLVAQKTGDEKLVAFFRWQMVYLHLQVSIGLLLLLLLLLWIRTFKLQVIQGWEKHTTWGNSFIYTEVEYTIITVLTWLVCQFVSFRASLRVSVASYDHHVTVLMITDCC